MFPGPEPWLQGDSSVAGWPVARVPVEENTAPRVWYEACPVPPAWSCSHTILLRAEAANGHTDRPGL